MKRLKLAALLFLAGAVLFTNLMCSKEETPTSTSSTAAANVICPLAVGNYWVYADSFADTNGVFTWGDSSKLGIGSSVNILHNDTNYCAYLWSWYWNVADSLTSTQDGYPFINMSDGLRNIGINDTSLFNQLLFKYPCSVGNSWDTYGSISYSPSDSSYDLFADIVNNECISRNVSFKCGIGTISCYEYRQQSSYKGVSRYNGFMGIPNHQINKGHYATKYTYDCDLYFAPNIGYLGLIEKIDGVVIYKKTLKRYHKN